MEITRQVVYKMVSKGCLQASKITSRLSFIKRSDIDEMIKLHPHEFRMPKDTLPITDFYTTAEIKEKFNVAKSWIFVITKKNKNLKTLNRGKTRLIGVLRKEANNSSFYTNYSVKITGFQQLYLYQLHSNLSLYIDSKTYWRKWRFALEISTIFLRETFVFTS